MHIIIGIEAEPENINAYIDWIKRRGEFYKKNIQSKNNHWGVKVREFRLLDLVFPKEYKENLLKDLTCWISCDKRYEKILNNPFIKRGMKKSKIEPFDIEYFRKQKKIGNYLKSGGIGIPKFQAKTFPIGIIHDRICDGNHPNPYFIKGRELI